MRRLLRRSGGFLFVLPSLLGVSLFVLVPFLDVLRRSFTGAMSGAFVGMRNYLSVLSNEAFQLAAANTLRFCAVCMPLLLGFSLLLALLLTGNPAKAGFFKTTFLLPMAVPVASVALLWKVFFHQSGLLSAALSACGLQSTNWMASGWAFHVLVGSYLWKNTGYVMVLWLAGLSGISPAIYEAARVDGANEWTLFRRITLPNLLPSFYTITVLSFLNSFKVFREAYLVAGDYPDTSIYLLQHLFNNWFRNLEMDKLAAAAVLTALVILGLILLLRRAWEEEP